MSTHLIPMLIHNSNDFDTVFAVIKLFVRVTMPPVGVSSAYRQASSHRPERWSNLVPASVIADDLEDATKRDLSACLHEYALLSGPFSGVYCIIPVSWPWSSCRLLLRCALPLWLTVAPRQVQGATSG